MSDLSNKCVLLKGLPPHFLQGDVEKVLKNGDFFSGVDKIQDHLERQNDKRWIVLFKTEEDATKCFNRGKWLTEIENETVSAIPDFCSECIIPEEWTTASQKDQSWVLIQDQDRWSSVSSVSSSELFAGGTSLPFQPPADTETNTEVYKNNFEDDGRCTTDEFEIKSDSFLFGSGYKQPCNTTDDTKKVSDTFTFILDSGSQDTKAGKIRDSGEKQEAGGAVSSNGTKPPVSPRNIPRNQKRLEREVLPTLPSAASDEGIKPSFRGSTQSPTFAKTDNFSATYVIQKVSEPSTNVATNAQGENSTIESHGNTIIQSFETYSAAVDQRPAPDQRPEPDQRQSTVEYQRQPDINDYTRQQMYQSPPYHAGPQYVYVKGFGPMLVVDPSPTSHIAHAAAAAQYPPPMYLYPPTSQAVYPQNLPYPTSQNVPPLSQAPPPPLQPDTEVNKQVYSQADFSELGVSEYLTPVQISTAETEASKTACNTKSVEQDLQIREIPHSPKRDKVVSEPLTINERAPMPLPKMPVPKQRSSKLKAIYSRDKSQKSPSSPEIKAQIAGPPDWDDLREPPDQDLHATETVITEEPLYEEIPADAIQDNIKPVNVPTERPLSSVQGRKLPYLPTEKKKTKTMHYRKSHKSMDIVEDPNDSASKVPIETSEERLGEVEETNEDLREERHTTNKIIVTGRKETTSLENLTFFFENKRKTGGDDTVNVELKTDPDAVIIEFRDSSVVTSVLQMQEINPFKLEGAVLSVRAYTPPPVDPHKVFLTGLKEGTSSESLEIFIEVITGMSPESIVYGDTPGTVLLTFEEAPDYTKLQQGLKKRPLEEKVLSASKIDVSSTVKVTGYGSDVSEETLCYYLENTKRSGGGEVLHIKTEGNRSLVQFKNSDDAERVCDGRKHVIGKSAMTVSLYYNCLDWDKSFSLQIPDPLKMPDLDTYVIKFIQTPKYKQLIESKLSTVFGAPVWPLSKADCLQIRCTVDPTQKESVTVMKDWEQNCRRTVCEITDTIDVNEDICVQKEIWSKAIEALQEVDVRNPDDVAVIPKKEEMKIVIFGLKEAVVELTDNISSILANIEKREMEDSREITKKLVLKMFEVALLNSVKFFNQSNFSGIDVTVAVSGREVTFSGQRVKVDQVISTMKEQLAGFVKKSFVANKAFKDLMFEKEIRNYIKTKMMKRKVLGVWDVVKGDEQIFMYSKTNKQAQTAVDIVLECLHEKTIPLDLRMEELIDGQNGKTFTENLLVKHQGLLKLEKTVGQLTVITVDYLIKGVCEEVMQFLDLHVIREEFINVESGKLCFINRFLRDNLDQISNQYKSLSVVVEEQETEYRQGFKIKGQKDGCRLAIRQLQSVLERVISNEHSIKSNDFDVSQYFESTEGRNELHTIEMKEKCVLKIKPDVGTFPKKSIQSYSAVRKEFKIDDCKLTVIEGDMTEMHDLVDVLVSPANIYLSNTDELANIIIEKGGYEIQKEMEAYEKTHDLSYCDVIVSKAGTLKCKHVFHVVSPEWRGGAHNEEKMLQMAVKNCFDKMSETKTSTIALPAIGTGRFGFPKDKVLPNLLTAVKSFLSNKDSSFVKEIYLCDLKRDVVKGLIREVRQQFEDIIEMRSNEPHVGGSYQDKMTFEREESRSPVPTRASRRSHERKIKVSVVTDELAKQKVDVIVNSTNSKLDLKVGTIAKSLLKVGGEALMHDLQQKYPDGIKLGDVARSVSGQLQCREVYHGVMSKWDKGQGTSEMVMANFVHRCLELADKRGMTSLAFPALGTGVLGFPADIVARLLFETIQDYEYVNPDTGIRSVLLVVYYDDTPTVQAFKLVQEKMRSGSFESRGSRKSFAQTFSMSPADLGKNYRFTIGPVSVTILQADITKEKTEFVVNSTIEELNLSTGAVSKAILNAAGSSLQSECHLPENVQRMKENGFIVTGPGNMMCGRILHIKARSKLSSWEETVKVCLKTVEDKGASSVSFPALGTGGKGCSPESVAKAMFSAFRQYIQSSEYKSTLKSIRIVIFQSEMVKVFVGASKEESKTPLKFLQKLRPKSKESKVLFLIYADSMYKTTEVKNVLDSIIVDESIYPGKQVFDYLKDRQVDKIERMADDKNMGIHVHTRSGSIRLNGARCSVKTAKDEIEAYLYNIKRDTEAKKATKAALEAAKGTISLPKSWGKMGLSDATQVTTLAATDSDYVSILNKFRMEAPGYFAAIVKIERIQNPTLYTQYMAKKKHMELANKSGNVERMLWHGTSGQAVANINNKGFDRNYNAGASHGVGVYLAVKAVTSVQGYCSQDALGQKYIYLARVLTGDFCVGRGAIRVPPPKPGGNPHDTYDSTTDNMAAPNFFVVFHDSQAYPEFLITFR